MVARRIVWAPLAAALAVACSGSGSRSTPPADGSSLAPGPHTISVSIAVDAATAVPVSGVSLSMALPPGVTIATAGTSPELAADAILVGGAVPGTPIVSGAFASASGTVTAVVAATPDAPWSGELLRLRVRVEPGTSVSAADLVAARAVTVTKAVGYDPVAHRSVLLTSQAHATSTLADVTP